MIPNFDVSVDPCDKRVLEITIEDKALEPILVILISGVNIWLTNLKDRSMTPINISKAKDEVRKILDDFVDRGVIYKFYDEWHIDEESKVLCDEFCVLSMKAYGRGLTDAEKARGLELQDIINDNMKVYDATNHSDGLEF